MSYGNTPLAPEVEYVMRDPGPRGVYSYGLIIKAGEQITEEVKVMSIDTVENYANSYAPVITLDVFMGAGLYSKVIYPNREQLEITVIRTNNADAREIQTQTFRGILLSEKNPVVDESAVAKASQFTLDLSSMLPVSFQLESRAIEQLRMVTLGTTMRQARMQDVIETALTTAIGQIDVKEEEKLLGVTMLGKPNDQVYGQLQIDHGTPLFNIPGILQKLQYGVYVGDIGHFFRDHQWYVYPIYDTEGFEEASTTLSITLLPTEYSGSLDRTYRVVGGTVMILATGERALNNSGEKKKINEGEGTRFANADLLFSPGWLDTQSQSNKAIAARSEGFTEIVMEGEQRANTNAPMSSRPISGNKYAELSKIASRKGMFFTCEWRNANKDLIEPGMNARVKYLEGDVVRMFEGRLVGMQAVDRLLGKGVASNQFGTSMMMSFYVQRDLDMDL